MRSLGERRVLSRRPEPRLGLLLSRRELLLTRSEVVEALRPERASCAS